MHRRCFRIHPAQASTPQPADPACQGKHGLSKTLSQSCEPPAPRAPASPKLQNTSFAADSVQIPLSLILFELSSYYVNAVQLHVHAADVLVRRGIDSEGSR